MLWMFTSATKEVRSKWVASAMANLKCIYNNIKYFITTLRMTFFLNCRIALKLKVTLS